VLEYGIANRQVADSGCVVAWMTKRRVYHTVVGRLSDLGIAVQILRSHILQYTDLDGRIYAAKGRPEAPRLADIAAAG